MGPDLTARMRIDKGAPGEIVYRVAEGAGWRDLLTVSVNETFALYELASDMSHVLAISSRGRDRAALVQVDLSDGSETVLVEEPDEDIFDIVDFTRHDGQIDAVLTHVGDSGIIPLTPRGETVAQIVADMPGRVEVEALNWSGDGRFVAASLSPDAKGYETYVLDLDTGTADHLGTHSFRDRYGDDLADTQEVTIPARDGMALHALLVRPKGVSGPVPTVIEVHGGPAQHLIWQYHRFRQFLANRGYAVLAVNFRGSTGFGKAYQAAGFGQAGRAMQDDLVDAANWAVAQGIADPDALAINGGSYGGYAAAMAMVRDPGLFAAAIVEHAVLDLPYQMRNNPNAWNLTPEYMVRYFGDPDDAEDLEAMRDRSPITHVDRLEAPVLMVAGKRDRIVGFEQTEAFVRAAEDAGKQVETLIFEDEGHGLDRWQSNIRYARRVEDFLATHLGGRSGGWDWIEIAAETLD